MILFPFIVSLEEFSYRDYAAIVSIASFLIERLFRPFKIVSLEEFSYRDYVGIVSICSF